MAKLIKNTQIIDDNWTVLTAEQCDGDLPETPILVPVSVWKDKKDSLKNRENLGIWFEGSDEPETIADDLNSFDVIAINVRLN